MTRLPPHLRNTGMMFQSYALWPHMTVAKNVAFGLEERKVAARGDRRSACEQALASVQMDALRRAQASTSSPAASSSAWRWRARWSSARAACCSMSRSRISTRKLRLEMRAEIRRICKEFGLTAIYVTHDQKEALSIADRMAILEGGHIRQVGTPAEVYRRPHSRFVADFMGETNFLDGKSSPPMARPRAVETAIGDFDATRRRRWLARRKPATPCTLSIRPESWKLCDQRRRRATPCRAASATASISARWRSISSPRAGQTLKIFELNPRFVELSPERELFASVAPEDVVALPRMKPMLMQTPPAPAALLVVLLGADRAAPEAAVASVRAPASARWSSSRRTTKRSATNSAAPSKRHYLAQDRPARAAGLAHARRHQRDRRATSPRNISPRFRTTGRTRSAARGAARSQRASTIPKVALDDTPADDTPSSRRAALFSTRTSSCKLDLFFGGGAFDFEQQARAGRLVDSGFVARASRAFQ